MTAVQPKQDAAYMAKMMAGADHLRAGNGSAPLSTIDDIPDVDITLNATQKYVLVQVGGKEPGSAVRYLVRGNSAESFHKDVATPIATELQRRNVTFRVIGGGRLEHSDKEGFIKIWSLSYAFPWENGIYKHDLTASVLRKTFGDKFKIEWKDEE
jgi:hypothetical protein